MTQKEQNESNLSRYLSQEHNHQIPVLAVASIQEFQKRT